MARPACKETRSRTGTWTPSTHRSRVQDPNVSSEDVRGDSTNPKILKTGRGTLDFTKALKPKAFSIHIPTAVLTCRLSNQKA